MGCGFFAARQGRQGGWAGSFPRDGGRGQGRAAAGPWVVAPGVDTRRRVLYLHGGAFMMGSPRSHRSITNRLSEVANAAVFALDYRLLPEHIPLDCIADCQKVYRWILQNVPD